MSVIDNQIILKRIDFKLTLHAWEKGEESVLFQTLSLQQPVEKAKTLCTDMMTFHLLRPVEAIEKLWDTNGGEIYTHLSTQRTPISHTKAQLRRKQELYCVPKLSVPSSYFHFHFLLISKRGKKQRSKNASDQRKNEKENQNKRRIRGGASAEDIGYFSLSMREIYSQRNGERMQKTLSAIQSVEDDTQFKRSRRTGYLSFNFLNDTQSVFFQFL